MNIVKRSSYLLFGLLCATHAYGVNFKALEALANMGSKDAKRLHEIMTWAPGKENSAFEENRQSELNEAKISYDKWLFVVKETISKSKAKYTFSNELLEDLAVLGSIPAAELLKTYTYAPIAPKNDPSGRLAKEIKSKKEVAKNIFEQWLKIVTNQ